jgi:hypothetical protein
MTQDEFDRLVRLDYDADLFDWMRDLWSSEEGEQEVTECDWLPCPRCRSLQFIIRIRITAPSPQACAATFELRCHDCDWSGILYGYYINVPEYRWGGVSVDPIDSDELQRMVEETLAAGLVADPGWGGDTPISPEETLRAAGIDDARQAEYQRKASALLSGREAPAFGGTDEGDVAR